MENTGTRNETFDLVSVLYHALEAVETCGKYRKDASDANDTELLSFLDEVIAGNRSIADGAKDLLRKRFVKGSDVDADERVDHTMEETFPASDPPATY